MDLTIVLSFAGIIVSIFVGFGTFYLADKRARRNRWQNSKDMVLQDLSKSLGEGNVPDAAIIQATIRSVLRSQNANDLSAVTLDEIADDLLRQITSDPFLNSERRGQLQGEVLNLKAKTAQEAKELPFAESKKEEAVIERSVRLTWSTLVSLLAGITASLVASLGWVSIERVIDFLKQTNISKIIDYSIPMIAAILTVIISIISLILSKKNKDDKYRKK